MLIQHHRKPNNLGTTVAESQNDLYYSYPSSRNTSATTTPSHTPHPSTQHLRRLGTVPPSKRFVRSPPRGQGFVSGGAVGGASSAEGAGERPLGSRPETASPDSSSGAAMLSLTSHSATPNASAPSTPGAATPSSSSEDSSKSGSNSDSDFNSSSFKGSESPDSVNWRTFFRRHYRRIRRSEDAEPDLEGGDLSVRPGKGVA